ncbi:Innexin eat-5 [Trichinella patagoniensis]|uniref:Innexin n=1 Tax=Trichinella patagoniensis TaxID=990121 RepID=A0A0V0ZUM1_9BILA|nr:Innexin eat-5 [Trichinella patagoniensis]
MFPLDNKFDMFFNFYGFEDFIDRMHFLFTVKVVVTYLVVMSFTDILTPRIKCWSPHHFVKSWEKYAETYCFIHSTYYYTNSSIVEGTEGKKHGFHFWATYVLAIQAILFATPAVIAAFLTKKSTANILSLINTNVESPSKEDEISKHLQFKLSNYLKFYRINSSIFGFNNVALTQFIAVSWIFKRKSFFWGVEVAVEYLKTGKWSQSEHFPITTFCDFNVREMNECLELTTKDKDKYHNDLVVKFTKEILQWDGVKLLRLIKLKLSNIAAKTITRNLFREFTKECCVTSGNEETAISTENSREERRNQKNGERKQTLPFPRDMFSIGCALFTSLDSVLFPESEPIYRCKFHNCLLSTSSESVVFPDMEPIYGLPYSELFSIHFLEQNFTYKVATVQQIPIQILYQI